MKGADLVLKAGHTYLLIGNISDDTGKHMEVSATFSVTDGSASSYMQFKGYGSVANGGGVSVMAIITAGTDCTVKLGTYNYTSEQMTYNFNAASIMLN